VLNGGACAAENGEEEEEDKVRVASVEEMGW
jgi:hypothetical protein